MEKYCPLQQEVATCSAWCAWYDETNKRCEISKISDRLLSLEESINSLAPTLDE